MPETFKRGKLQRPVADAVGVPKVIKSLTLVATITAGLSFAVPVSASATTYARERGATNFDIGHNHYHNHALVKQHNANGVHNRMASVINSPNFMHGMQEVTNSNAGGNIITQNALCRRRTFCRLSNNALISR